MTLVGKIRELKLWPEIQRRNALYTTNFSKEERLSWQLHQFNNEWQHISETIPYYRDLKNRLRLPQEFRNWNEFLEVMPVTSRQILQDNLDKMVRTDHPPEWFRITGGSTAQPIQLPAWNSERNFLSPNVWLGRSWLGVKPNDRAFWIWGHSHLLGFGFKGWVNARKRELFDRLLGYFRFSAYDLNQKKMRKAGDALLRFNPNYILSYSVALDAFARANQDRADLFHKLNLKIAIGLAEAFPFSDSQEVISRILGAPVAMEYGSVETSLMATLIPMDDYRTYWRSYFLEALEPGISGGKIIRVTSLYPRCFPLIRYDHGDEIELSASDPDGIGLSHIKKVMGRCNDYVELADGSKIHSEVFTHVVRGVREISSYQVVQYGIEDIRFLFSVKSNYSPQIEENIKRRLKIVHPDLEKVQFDLRGELMQTIAGKTPMVIRKNNF